MQCAVILMLAMLAPAEARQLDLASMVTPLEYRYTGGGYKNQLFRYRLYIPKSATRERPLPLLVWLHGLSQAGSGNVAQMKGLDKLVFLGTQEQDYPFFVLAVQCPGDNRRWSPCEDPKKQDDMINVLAAILSKTLKDYPVDAERVSMTGLSSGGNGCWEFASRHGEYLSALAPHGSGGMLGPGLNRLKRIPVWAFHSIDDEGVSIAYVRGTIKSLKREGGNACLTEIPSESSHPAFFAGHDCWTAAFHDYDLLDWLLAQRRGQSSWWNGPGRVPWSARVRSIFRGWEPWQLALQVAIPASLAAAVWAIVKQRKASRG